jgi:hypothetical protein
VLQRVEEPRVSWNYGDDPTWYVIDPAWSSFSSTPEKETIMTVALSPKQEAQKAVDQVKKLQIRKLDGGRWYHHEELGVVVLDPPRHAFIFALHIQSLKFFRSQTRNSDRLTTSSLRTIIDPERGWLVEALKTAVPGGQDYLAFERGDQSVMARRALAAAKVKPVAPKPPLERQRESSTPPRPEARPVSRPRSQEVPRMALLDIQTKTRTVTIEERSQTLELGRRELVAILRSAGAPTLRKDAKILVIGADGRQSDLGEEVKIRLEWTESKETESSS